MDFTLVAAQFLNGLQLGVLLFLLAAGLTLVFGIMDCVNLAHGSLYMVGAFVCATVTLATGSFLLGVLAALPRHLRHRGAGRGPRHPPPLPARPPRPGARHVRTHPRVRHPGPPDLGPGGPELPAAAEPQRPGGPSRERGLPRLPPPHHRGRARRRPRDVDRHHPDPDRDAGPGGSLESPARERARDQHPGPSSPSSSGPGRRSRALPGC